MLTVVPKFLATNRCCISASFLLAPVAGPDDEAAAPDDEAAAPDDGAAAPCCAAHSLAYRAAASSDVSCCGVTPVGYNEAAAADAAALRLACSLSVSCLALSVASVNN